jgi:hypothetical protein
MNPPACRHRGEQLLPDRWLCFSSRLVLRTGLVSAETCRTRCPYVDHPADPAAGPDAPGIEVALVPGLVAVGVTTAPRPMSTLPQTVAELRRAGFTQPTHVFAEPATPVPNDPGIVVHRNAARLGMWGNYTAAARWLLDHTDAPFVLLCEDDVRFVPCAALALQHAIDTLPHETWGYVSLYTPRHNLRGGGAAGWHHTPVGAFTWGSLAWCFTREGLRAVLDSRIVRRHAGTRGTDTVVSQAINEVGRRCYFHVPSLGDHLGADVSTQGGAHGSDSLPVGFSPTYRGYTERRGRSACGRARIPRRIHQIWIGPKPPPVEWMRTWAERHPGWEYRLWTEHTIPFPLRNQAQFDASPQYAGKADVLRYEVLLREGGIYVDADVWCLRPFTEDDLRQAFLGVYEDESRHPGVLNNGLIGCEPGCPVLADAVTAIGRLSAEEVARTPPEVCTGPALLTRCLKGRMPLEGAKVFPSEAFMPVYYTADAVDPGRLASARGIHFFQRGTPSAEFAAFKHASSDGRAAFPDELTVVVPAHPDTAMGERSVASLRLLGEGPRLFVFDGDLRRALEQVRTPYLLYWGHDWELTRPIDVRGVLRTLRDHPGVRSIRLNRRVTLEADGDLALLQRPDQTPVPLVATPCWPSDPHFARTQTYRSFVLPSGASLLVRSLRDYKERGLARQHEDWGNCIYGSLGDAAVVRHLDGAK